MRNGYVLTGTTNIAHQAQRVQIYYLIQTGADWRTTNARIRIPQVDVHLEVTASPNGAWRVNGRIHRDLSGCVDLDLGWTPATNTLPIRRFGVEVGDTITTRAAWLQWPQLAFTAVDQVYTRSDEMTWTYQHGDFKADLEVDEYGVVVTYGDPPIWYSI